MRKSANITLPCTHQAPVFEMKADNGEPIGAHPIICRGTSSVAPMAWCSGCWGWVELSTEMYDQIRARIDSANEDRMK